MRRIGLLGGSFNPAHGGHRAISLFARAALGLDEIWWMVSPGNPLKPAAGMAPLPARYRSAQAIARRAPIRVTAVENTLGTRYTADSVRALVRRYPKHRFIWLMGADNLDQFSRWHDWRGVARSVTIAVIARPGYDADARAGAAMGWLRRFVRPASTAQDWIRWSPPALVLLRFRPDPRSATALRALAPDWHRTHLAKADHALRDAVTHRPIRARQHPQEVICPHPQPR